MRLFAVKAALRVAAVAALLLLATAAPAANAEAARQVPARFLGMFWGDGIEAAPQATQDAAWNLMSRAGVETARVVFNWSLAQPEADGPIDFTALDRVVARAARTRIELVPIVMYAPRWARIDDALAAPPKDPQTYADFVAALVHRYGPRGSFWRAHRELPYVPLRYWQIWNEPHLPYQWTVPGGREYRRYAFPNGYVALLRAASAAVHGADRAARVVLAGLTNDSWNQLSALYNAGVRGLFDVGAVQTYTGKPANVVRALRLFRAVMRSHGDGRKGLWATEVGWPAAKGRARIPRYAREVVTDDRGVVKRLLLVHRLLVRAARDRRIGVQRVYWYSWITRYRDRQNIFDYTGLLAWDGKRRFVRKPAFRAYVAVARALAGCARRSDGSCVPLPRPRRPSVSR